MFNDEPYNNAVLGYSARKGATMRTDEEIKRIVSFVPPEWRQSCPVKRLPSEIRQVHTLLREAGDIARTDPKVQAVLDVLELSMSCACLGCWNVPAPYMKAGVTPLTDEEIERWQQLTIIHDGEKRQ